MSVVSACSAANLQQAVINKGYRNNLRIILVTSSAFAITVGRRWRASQRYRESAVLTVAHVASSFSRAVMIFGACNHLIPGAVFFSTAINIRQRCVELFDPSRSSPVGNRGHSVQIAITAYP